MALHSARVLSRGAEPERWLCVVHGILGCGGNWRTFARSLVNADPSLGVLLLDLRHHGRSGPLDGSCTMAACAQDLESTFEEVGIWPAAIAGHSFGGKVVLHWSHRSERPPQECWVLDSPPGLRNHGHDPGERMIGRVIDAMERTALPAQERGDVIDDLVEQGVPPGVSTWLTTNLTRAAGEPGYTWRIDLSAIRGLLDGYFRLDGWPLIEALGSSTQVHLVQGDRSDRWTGEELARVTQAAQERHVFDHVVPDAGHWLHVDNPNGLMDVMRSSPFFSGLTQGPRMVSRPGSEQL